MSCERIEARLADLVAGHVDGTAARESEAHLLECPSCRKFHRRIAALYAIPEPTGTTGSPPPNLTPYRWYQRPFVPRLMTSVAAILVLCVAGLALREADRYEPLPLPDIALRLPSYPTDYPEATTFEGSLADALLLGRFTGRPVLEEYSSEVCPRCRHVASVLRQPDRQAELQGFIVRRIEMNADNAPDWVRDSKPDGRLLFMLPAMRITDGVQSSDPIWAVAGFDSVRELTLDWQQGQEQLEGRLEPLGRELFEGTAGRLSAISELVADRKYDSAFMLLDAIVSLRKTHRSEFIEVAATARDELLEQLQQALDEIERLRQGSRKERLQGEDLAARLAPYLIGTQIP